MEALMKLLLILAMAFSMNTFAKGTIPTVEKVEVDQYVGKWFAILSLPQIFTKKCVAQTADYAIKSPNSISVLNTCIKADSSTKIIEGQAVVTNAKTNAELEVTFNNFWTKLFRVKGDYNIIKLDDSYSTVMVGSINRKSLWIMSRTPYISDETRKEYVEYAKSLGFDVTKLIESKF
jgi:apolipoprotein D and lipocalin family protein